MKIKTLLWAFLITSLVIALIGVISILIIVGLNRSSEMGMNEKQFYNQYLMSFLSSDGSVISNYQSVSWCPNSGIGCDQDITSEAIARLSYYAVENNDKEILDKEINFYYTKMKNPSTGFMMWKINSDGTPTIGGNGFNSAVDSELIFIESLLIADDKWGKDSNGIRYKDTARIVMDSLKSGLVVSDGEYYLPYCMYAQGNESKPCENKIFLGYLNLVAIKEMCRVDSFWCDVYDSSKSVMIGAVRTNGVYSAYNVNTKSYSYENADIHPNWVISNLARDGNKELVKPFYLESRKYFYENDTKVCQEFDPNKGCKLSNAPLRVYAHYLDLSVLYNDKEFRDDLIDYIEEKRLSGAEGNAPLCSKDNYGNIVVLQSYLNARNSGANI